MGQDTRLQKKKVERDQFQIQVLWYILLFRALKLFLTSSTKSIFVKKMFCAMCCISTFRKSVWSENGACAYFVTVPGFHGFEDADNGWVASQKLTDASGECLSP